VARKEERLGIGEANPRRSARGGVPEGDAGHVGVEGAGEAGLEVVRVLQGRLREVPGGVQSFVRTSNLPGSTPQSVG
jgi:hypothetical protein